MKTVLPTYSVLIANYNYGRFLPAAIESVLDQTISPENYEIIVVDDGSTDESREILAGFSRHKNIKVHFQDNAGHAAALNAAFALSRGKYVCPLDADDIFAREKLEKIGDAFRKTQARVVFHNLETFSDEEGGTRRFADAFQVATLVPIGAGLYRASGISAGFSYPFLAVLSGQSFERTIAEKLFPIPKEYIRHTDSYLHQMAYALGPIYFLDEPLARYRQHRKSHLGSLRSGDLAMMSLASRLSELTREHVRSIAPMAAGLHSVLFRKSLERKLAFLVHSGQRIRAARELVQSAPLLWKMRKATLFRLALYIVSPTSLDLRLKRIYRRLDWTLQMLSLRRTAT